MQKIKLFALAAVLVVSVVGCNDDANKKTETTTTSTDSSTIMSAPTDSTTVEPMDSTTRPNMNPEDTGRGVKPIGG